MAKKGTYLEGFNAGQQEMLAEMNKKRDECDALRAALVKSKRLMDLCATRQFGMTIPEYLRVGAVALTTDRPPFADVLMNLADNMEACIA